MVLLTHDCTDRRFARIAELYYLLKTLFKIAVVVENFWLSFMLADICATRSIGQIGLF